MVQGRYLEVERDKEGFSDLKIPPIKWGGRSGAHSFKMPRNKKAERKHPEYEMTDNTTLYFEKQFSDDFSKMCF
jgi:hypothetical protein